MPEPTLSLQSIDPGQQFTWEHSNLEANKPKNRYANVIAYDHSRVILQPLEGSQGLCCTCVVGSAWSVSLGIVSAALIPTGQLWVVTVFRRGAIGAGVWQMGG